MEKVRILWKLEDELNSKICKKYDLFSSTVLTFLKNKKKLMVALDQNKND